MCVCGMYLRDVIVDTPHKRKSILKYARTYLANDSTLCETSIYFRNEIYEKRQIDDTYDTILTNEVL